MCPVAAKLFHAMMSPPAAAFELGVISSVQGQHEEEPSLVVVGGGAAGVYASIRAKTLAPHLNVAVVEKGRFLSKVKISGGGRCNVTNGHHLEPMVTSNLASYSYPGRGRCPRHHPACHCRSRVAAMQTYLAVPVVLGFAGTGEKLSKGEQGAPRILLYGSRSAGYHALVHRSRCKA